MLKLADAGVRPVSISKKSSHLRIILGDPKSFAGRKVGVLVRDSVNAKPLVALKVAVEKEGALFKIVAAQVGGGEGCNARSAASGIYSFLAFNSSSSNAEDMLDR
jgi:hypothetical protein